MSLPSSIDVSTDTVVTYPDGDLTSTGTVLHLEPLADGRTAVVLDRTAFHPVDPVWPDQPADAGELTADGRSYPVVAAVVGATDGTTLYVGDAPVRTGTAGWAFVVAHLVDDVSGLEPGSTVTVAVDAERRRALSAGHTACHLASLALNDALAPLWTKEAPMDGRGRPNFDQLAITSSRILEDGSLDEYRIGKSLRKKGFAAAELASRLAEATEEIDRTLAGWVASGAGVSIVRDGDGRGLGERRRWRAELPEGIVEIPCGGTHVRGLDELAAITVALELGEADGALTLTMRTTARRA
ncbi:metal-dependent hydrolase [Leifsonia sp. 2MCAF36]|uniref:metal-dependent hydrolase n=1 Tax=Leifsonia sp. 2MCAF36 TaxID=3232988 RepID=UPI003F98FC31